VSDPIPSEINKISRIFAAESIRVGKRSDDSEPKADPKPVMKNAAPGAQDGSANLANGFG